MRILTVIERPYKRLPIHVPFEKWILRIYIQIQLVKSLLEEVVAIKDFYDCSVARFMLIQNGFESTRGIRIELVWLTRIEAFIIGKIPGLLIDGLGPMVRHHVEYDSNKLKQDVTFAALREEVLIFCKQPSKLNLYQQELRITIVTKNGIVLVGQHVLEYRLFLIRILEKVIIGLFFSL